MAAIRLGFALMFLCAGVAVVYMNFVAPDLDEAAGTRMPTPGARLVTLESRSYELWVEGRRAACPRFSELRRSGIRLVAAGGGSGLPLRGTGGCRTEPADAGSRHSSAYFEAATAGRYRFSARRPVGGRAEVFLVARPVPADLVRKFIWGAVALVLFGGIPVSLFGGPRDGDEGDMSHLHHNIG